jgi:hypothetical protein
MSRRDRGSRPTFTININCILDFIIFKEYNEQRKFQRFCFPMKRILLTAFLCAVTSAPLLAAAQFRSGTSPLVDGIYQSTQVVVTGRAPLLSWSYGSVVSSFTIVVSSDDVFDTSGEIWNYRGTTTTVNSINFITRIPFNEGGAAAVDLEAGETYHWQVTLYDNGTSSAAASFFSTVSAAITLSGSPLDLAVDWNNPFDPGAGQFTVFRYTAKDRDRRVQLRVFTLSGELVRDWPEHSALRNAWYTQQWDGRNADGDVVARGLYFVNIIDVGDNEGVTRRVAVQKQ